MSATTAFEVSHVDPERGLTAAEVSARVSLGQINDVAAIVWSFARLFVPGEQPVGPRARDPLFGGLGSRRRDDSASSPDETR